MKSTFKKFSLHPLNNKVEKEFDLKIKKAFELSVQNKCKSEAINNNYSEENQCNMQTVEIKKRKYSGISIHINNSLINNSREGINQNFQGVYFHRSKFH